MTLSLVKQPRSRAIDSEAAEDSGAVASLFPPAEIESRRADHVGKAAIGFDQLEINKPAHPQRPRDRVLNLRPHGVVAVQKDADRPLANARRLGDLGVRQA